MTRVRPDNVIPFRHPDASRDPGFRRDDEFKTTAYAELAVTTSFSFLRGASHPQEMVAMADELGLAAIGIADRNSLAGVVRAYDEARKRKMRLLVGTRLITIDGFEAITYPMDRAAYGRLCRLLTAGNCKTKKSKCHITLADILAMSEGQLFMVQPPEDLSSDFIHSLTTLGAFAPGRVFLAGIHHLRGDEPRRLGLLDELGRKAGTPMVAVNDVHYHMPERRVLADVVTCIREKCTIAEAGFRLEANAERHLKPPAEMTRLFADFPDAIARTLEVVETCRFSLDELKNEYPDEPVPPGKSAQQHLEDLTWAGAAQRYPRGLPGKIATQIRQELAIIADLDYARYFLTVHDVVAFAKSKEILCQGRGSAANSAVCYCLHITDIDPETNNLLFARFISTTRNEPPDIDVDFEHERREIVIQHIYKRYGRERAAICATVIHYRWRRAIREVGKALGLTEDITAALAGMVWGYGEDGMPDHHIRQTGLDPENPTIRQAVAIAGKLIGFPRHLSQHVGGFVLTRERLDETVPIGNAAMADRTFIEWDKDDIDTLRLMKVDVLALGMLSCLKRSFDLLNAYYPRRPSTMAAIQQSDQKEEVFDMLCRADSIGVFQVESRAQMSMLPRLKPRTFYDLVIEVAIVRPGPIQGDMVHPYLKRRDDPSSVSYPSPAPEHGPANELEEVLKRTLGVPLFQEQAMQIAITAAGFNENDADGLRRAMATFRHNGTVSNYREQFLNGMTKRGYDRDFAKRCFGQIEGFGEYGFPESHAASFALLVYVSAWIKCHHPDVFCATILNSQPMGFYQPAQLVRDAREHGIEVRPVDVNFSDWDSTLEPGSGVPNRHAVRLGFRQIGGLRKAEIDTLIKHRGNGFGAIERLETIPGVSRATIERLAEADAFRSLDLDRRQALWAARRLSNPSRHPGESRDPPLRATKISGEMRARTSMGPGFRRHDEQRELPLFSGLDSGELFAEPQIELPVMALSEHVVEDYVTTGLSLKQHPCAFFRNRLARLGAIRNRELADERLKQDSRITVSGLVLIRQRPGTSKGVVFMTLEDETGIANIIVWRRMFETHRHAVMVSRFLAVTGRLQRAGLVVHVVAERFIDLTPELRLLADGERLGRDGESHNKRSGKPPLLKSRDFH